MFTHSFIHFFALSLFSTTHTRADVVDVGFGNKKMKYFPMGEGGGRERKTSNFPTGRDVSQKGGFVSKKMWWVFFVVDSLQMSLRQTH